MKQKPRWTLEMLIAALAVLCALLTLALLVQRPAGWPALAVLVVLWGIGICVFRYQLRRWPGPPPGISGWWGCPNRRRTPFPGIPLSAGSSAFWRDGAVV